MKKTRRAIEDELAKTQSLVLYERKLKGNYRNSKITDIALSILNIVNYVYLE